MQGIFIDREINIAPKQEKFKTLKYSYHFGQSTVTKTDKRLP